MQTKSEIDQLLRQKCDAKEIPGVVAMAATASETIYQGAFGKRDLTRDDAMTADSVFWIASMTKAVTTAGAMQLVEQGKLSLDAPIGDVLPDLANPQVLEGFDANGEAKLRPAKRPITLRQLMTHTAGFCYNMWNGDLAVYLDKTGTPAITTCQNAALKTPIMTDPGTRWEYGINIDFVGKAVEAASGKRQALGRRAPQHLAQEQILAVGRLDLVVRQPALAEILCAPANVFHAAEVLLARIRHRRWDHVKHPRRAHPGAPTGSGAVVSARPAAAGAA